MFGKTFVWIKCLFLLAVQTWCMCLPIACAFYLCGASHRSYTYYTEYRWQISVFHSTWGGFFNKITFSLCGVLYSQIWSIMWFSPDWKISRPSTRLDSARCKGQNNSQCFQRQCYITEPSLKVTLLHSYSRIISYVLMSGMFQ